MGHPKKNKRTGLYGGYGNNRGNSFLTDLGDSLKKAKDSIYNPMRKKGYVKAGNKWVSKDTKSMAKDVMKHDVDFNKFNSYVSDSGRVKKSGTRKTRLQDAANLVLASKKEKKQGDDSLYSTYASLGQQKVKPTPPVSTTTSNVTASTTNKKTKRKPTNVSLDTLGVNLTYYKRGGKVKKSSRSGQYD
jgi:hypothetical protein